MDFMNSSDTTLSFQQNLSAATTLQPFTTRTCMAVLPMLHIGDQKLQLEGKTNAFLSCDAALEPLLRVTLTLIVGTRQVE
jgi:hypothetical protein